MLVEAGDLAVAVSRGVGEGALDALALAAEELARAGVVDRGWSLLSSGARYSLGDMSLGAAIALGAVIGLALGILVSVTTDVPLAPEIGLVLGALVGWLWRRDREPAA